MRASLLDNALYPNVQPATLTTSTATGNVPIPVAGAESVLHVALLGTITAGTVKLKVLESNTLAAGYAAISGLTETATAGDDSKILAVEISRPQKKYHKIQVVTSNVAVLESGLSLVAGAAHRPVTQSTTYVATTENILDS